MPRGDSQEHHHDHPTPTLDSPQGVFASDPEVHEDTPREPIQQFRGGGTFENGVFTRNVHHLTSEGPVNIPVAPAGAKLSFKSEAGQTILGRNASMFARVIVPGPVGETTVGAALNMGAIVEVPGGGFELPDAAPDAAPRRETKAEDEASDPEPVREFLDAEDEADLRSLESVVGVEDFAAVESFLVNDELPPEHMLDRLAGKFDGTREGVMAAIAEAAAPYQAQASVDTGVIFPRSAV
jgi:hypothetical protein